MKFMFSKKFLKKCQFGKTNNKKLLFLFIYFFKNQIVITLLVIKAAKSMNKN